MTRKTKYTVLTGAAFSTIIACCSIGSPYALAAEVHTPVGSEQGETEKVVSKHMDAGLAADGMKKKVVNIHNQVDPLHDYAKVIVSMNLSFPTCNYDRDSIRWPSKWNGNSFELLEMLVDHQELYEKIKGNLDVAKKNAKEWLDILEPAMNQINLDIMNSNKHFMDVYDNLVIAVEKKDKVKVKTDMENISTLIKMNRQNTEHFITQLKTFKMKVVGDTTTFTNHIQDLERRISENDAKSAWVNKKTDEYIKSVLAQKEKTIQQLNEEIDTYLKQNTSTGDQTLDKRMRELLLYKEDKKGLQNTKETMNMFVTKLDTAILAVKGLYKQWGNMSDQFESLLKDIDTDKPIHLNTLQELKSNWIEVQDYAMALSKNAQ